MTKRDAEIPVPPADGPAHEALIDPVHERTAEDRTVENCGAAARPIDGDRPVGWYVWRDDWLTRDGPFANEAQARAFLAHRRGDVPDARD